MPGRFLLFRVNILGRRRCFDYMPNKSLVSSCICFRNGKNHVSYTGMSWLSYRDFCTYRIRISQLWKSLYIERRKMGLTTLFGPKERAMGMQFSVFLYLQRGIDVTTFFPKMASLEFVRVYYT